MMKIASKEGKLIHINNTTKGHKFNCIECNGILIPKKGMIKEHHFAHISKKICNNTGETLEHKYSKQYIQDNINNITIIKECLVCKNKFTITFKNCVVKQEYRIFNFIVDLAIFENEELKYVIEIEHTHKTDWNKKRIIELYPLIFIEIKTKNIINNDYEIYEDYCEKCMDDAIEKSCSIIEGFCDRRYSWMINSPINKNQSILFQEDDYDCRIRYNGIDSKLTNLYTLYNNYNYIIQFISEIAVSRKGCIHRIYIISTKNNFENIKKFMKKFIDDGGDFFDYCYELREFMDWYFIDINNVSIDGIIEIFSEEEREIYNKIKE